ncbi:NAD(P)-binding domain-containing protein [Brevibacterium sp. 91QC2O2]|uniref:NAD(P)-binding domain-containing protein n=1 Tax=Brevibacterium TaxID=1696 RepID=UPI00211BB668|nr:MULTISPECIES: NAD(P)-binding domain-containing protein [unclassified Brevibacterium]MCQ9368375.1 NAD(P)-binding domain-containing protein [Brevibacterium sp. 91QC2O2]MCQ9384703.1 NAD(P)-binding domain-containing protein [Brevibacterium sp. 68QC2CO]
MTTRKTALGDGDTIGFIGVGEIARAMVEGLAGGPGAPAIVLSPRSRETSAELAKRYPQVSVAADNQAVVEAAGTIVLAVRPDQLHEAIAELNFGADTLIISVLAGVSAAEVAAAAGGGVEVVRAIPMPPVSHRAGLTVVWPEHPVSNGLFDLLGGALVVADEAQLSVFSAATGAVTGALEYIRQVAVWTAQQGVPPQVAEPFIRATFAGLAPALSDSSRDMAELVRDHETPGGLNEQLRTGFFDEEGRSRLVRELDGLHTRAAQG